MQTQMGRVAKVRSGVLRFLAPPMIRSVFVCMALLTSFSGELPAQKITPDYLALVRKHYDRFLDSGRDIHGLQKTDLWLATVDIVKGGLPDNPYPKDRRWYRDIVSPKGSNLYWDQSSLVAALSVSQRTGDQRYAAAAKSYVQDFIRRCVGANGLFLWGNHIYYDVVTDQPIFFSGGHHEMRPHMPAWDFLWEIAPAEVEACIHRAGEQHVTNSETGLFNRHASVTARTPPGLKERSASMPFLEAGGVLVESLSWLSAKTKDATLAELAIKVARYSYSQRNESTGLLRNQPVVRRWDYDASTTEIGLWSGDLLRAAAYTGKDEFCEMARQSMAAWLRQGFDEKAGLYYGQLAVADGKPLHPPEKRENRPALHAEIWEAATMPTHNYPLPMAEVCLTLFEQTGDIQFRLAVDRWIGHIRRSLPAHEGRGAYAEEYGRCIHFLVRASQVMKNEETLALAHQVAQEAVARLYSPEHGMFRGHPGEDRLDGVDNAGLLFLALLYLQTGEPPALHGMAY